MPKHKRRINPDTLVFLKQVGIGALVLSTAALLIVGIWYGSRVEALTLTTVEVNGGKTIEHKKIIDQVQNGLEGYYIGLVPKRFAWFYPQESLVNRVAEIERVHNVSVERINGKTLEVNFSEFNPQALWCESVESDNCLFLDNEGFAFANAPRLSGGSLVRFVTLGQDIQVGANITDFDNFASLLELVDLLTGRSLPSAERRKR
jgi:cell division septal protein FtsQ